MASPLYMHNLKCLPTDLEKRITRIILGNKIVCVLTALKPLLHECCFIYTEVIHFPVVNLKRIYDVCYSDRVTPLLRVLFEDNYYTHSHYVICNTVHNKIRDLASILCKLHLQRDRLLT